MSGVERERELAFVLVLLGHDLSAPPAEVGAFWVA